MLSRVAERVYWAARYLERIENTARLIAVYDKLMFDLPRNLDIGWYNLITINSAEQLFGERYKVQDEQNVVKFFIRDQNNPSSIVSCLKMARENLRTTRDVIPADSWELINELNMFVNENVQKGVNRSQRLVFIDGVIQGCQQIQGLLSGCMPRDHVWDFMTLGRNLERADMTTRLMDAGVRAQMHTIDESNALYFRQVVWGNVLRSLEADQSYRRRIRSAVKGSLVAEYILEDPAFPRSIAHCMSEMTSAVSHLPCNEAVIQHMKTLVKKGFQKVNYDELGEPMKDYLNDLQLDLASLHTTIASNWFTT